MMNLHFAFVSFDIVLIFGFLGNGVIGTTCITL